MFLLKQQYSINTISENKGNTREPWKITNRLLNKGSKVTNITYIKDGGIKFREKTDASNTLNSYFCSVGEDLAKHIDKSSTPLQTGTYTVNQNDAYLEFKEVKCTHSRDAVCKEVK